MNRPLAPVALFVYNRLGNTRRTLEHLLDNTLARHTDLYIFSDGGRDPHSWKEVNAVRNYLHALRRDVEARGTLRSITLVERPENVYLERNIMEGIAQVFGRHDRIIVLEDDICTSPHFLQYMNDAFRLYEADRRVMHVSGFTNLSLDTPEDFYFTPHMSGWGWGTWRDRWQTHYRHYTSREEALHGLTPDDLSRMEYGGVFPCLKSLDKRPIPWDVCWELAIYRQQGLCLTPRHTLVRNIGLYNGTHFSHSRLLQRFEFDRPPLATPLHVIYRTPEASPLTEQLFAHAIRHWGIRYTPLGKAVRFFYLKWKDRRNKQEKTSRN
ncbi:MAG: glycosyltransferase [Clostridium sp.]|nr:glycosyltransferase [Clostridium sp.]